MGELEFLHESLGRNEVNGEIKSLEINNKKKKILILFKFKKEERDVRRKTCKINER